MQEGVIWGPKWGCFKMWIEHGPFNLLILSLAPKGSIWAWNQQIGGLTSNCPRRGPHFLPHILHTRSPTAPIWNILNGMESLLKRKKNIIEIKLKENGSVVGIIWGFKLFSHGNHHIRVYMHHVCLFQSISARKGTHTKLGTCSGSSQCQLHFGTKLVLIEWSSCECLPSECKHAHFRHFFRCPLCYFADFTYNEPAMPLLFVGSPLYPAICIPPQKRFLDDNSLLMHLMMQRKENCGAALGGF